ncbi:STAS domain-containing protein [Nonomuraea rhodomycinica]|uniref:Anti-sigma factor antagonist n=1 Tax=Nonomuraea rhodomycinica TaxID=1712872 RepID=A0A7Y6MB33_9ACTN|nr:STAS domain-containing protein [Nonomuraea rhodomycinica]NUW41868.1 STAS domain-containing protein [Nonomuraea rhodomycinica]
MQSLNVTLETQPRRAVAHLRGEIDLATAELLKASLDTMIEGPSVSALEVDLSQVSFIDCSGLRVLLAVKRSLQRRGGTLSLAHLSPSAERLLAAAGLDDHLVERAPGRGPLTPA